MLKKSLRLGRKDLGAFFKKRSKFAQGTLVSVRFTENSLKFSRFAFVVSFEDKQKRKGRAVLRNLIRRRMSEAVIGLVETLKPGSDIVFFLKQKGPKPPGFGELKEDIKNVISKSHLSRNIL